MTAISQEKAEKVAIARAGETHDRDDAIAFVDELFRSVQNENEPIAGWGHIETRNLPAHLGKYSIWRDSLRDCAQRYLSTNAWLADPSLDWLLANLLAFAELDAFLITTGTVARFKRSGRAHLAHMAWGAFKWLVWLLLVVFAFVASDAIGWGLLALTAIVQGLAWRNRKRISGLELAMMNAYQSIGSTTLSWNVVWDYLTKSRDLGAVWDPELYRLVELRKKAG